MRANLLVWDMMLGNSMGAFCQRHSSIYKVVELLSKFETCETCVMVGCKTLST